MEGNKLSESDVQTLIQSCQSGDTTAFEPIFRQFLDRIFRFVLFRVGGDRETAKDLTSEVFLEVYQSLSNYHPRFQVSFAAWLFSIARHTVADYHRAYRRGRNQVSLASVADILPDTSQLGVEKIITEQQYDQVVQAIQELPATLREILLLRLMEELSYPEIAQITGKSEGHLRLLVHRGIQRIKRHLKL